MGPMASPLWALLAQSNDQLMFLDGRIHNYHYLQPFIERNGPHSGTLPPVR